MNDYSGIPAIKDGTKNAIKDDKGTLFFLHQVNLEFVFYDTDICH